jgi:hypothetical protein
MLSATLTRSVTSHSKMLFALLPRLHLQTPYRLPCPFSRVATPLWSATPTSKGCHTPTECHAHLQGLPHPYRVPCPPPRFVTPLQNATPTFKGCHTPTCCHTHLQTPLALHTPPNTLQTTTPPARIATPLHTAKPTFKHPCTLPHPHSRVAIPLHTATPTLSLHTATPTFKGCHTSTYCHAHLQGLPRVGVLRTRA